MREKGSAEVKRYMCAKEARRDALITPRKTAPLSVANTRRHELLQRIRTYKKESVFHKGLKKLLYSLMRVNVKIEALNNEYLALSKDITKANNFLRKKRR